MGTDLTVVNAARASFGKESDWVWTFTEGEPSSHAVLNKADVNLIRFLASGFRTSEWAAFLKEIRQVSLFGSDDELTALLRGYKKKAQHWAPFAHGHIQIRVQMPIFLARQFVKHQIGGTWSEESRRYISDEPEVWFPAEWHSRPDDVKQGSGAELDKLTQKRIQQNAERATQVALDAYAENMRLGAAPEEARTILPLNMMTTVVWTGSLLFWSRVCNQRVDSHAQLAAQELGKLISGVVEPLFPVSWKELTC